MSYRNHGAMKVRHAFALGDQGDCDVNLLWQNCHTIAQGHFWWENTSKVQGPTLEGDLTWIIVAWGICLEREREREKERKREREEESTSTHKVCRIHFTSNLVIRVTFPVTTKVFSPGVKVMPVAPKNTLSLLFLLDCSSRN